MADLAINIRANDAGASSTVAGVDAAFHQTLAAIAKSVEELNQNFKKFAEESKRDLKEVAEEGEKTAKTLREKLVDSLKDAMKTVNNEAVGWGIGIARSLFGGLSSVVGMVTGLAGSLVGVFEGTVKAIGAVFNGLVSVVRGVASAILGTFEAMGSALGLVFNKVTALVAGAAGFIVFKLGESAAASESFAEGLDQLAKRAGTSAQTIVSAITDGSGKTITRMDAMRIANRALIQGVISTGDQFKELAQLADKLNDVLGVDTATAMEQLIVAIENGNEKMLKGLGIYADAGKALDDYAAKAGKKAADLTQEEKAQAFLNATLAAGAKIVADTSTKTDLLGDKYARLKVVIADTYETIASAFGPALGKLAATLEPLVKRTAEWAEANAGLLELKLNEWADGLANAIGHLVEDVPRLAAAFGEMVAPAKEVLGAIASGAWVGITDVIAGARREFDLFAEAFAHMNAGLGFNPQDSALLAGFDVIRASARVLATDVAKAFSDSFSDAAVRIANFAADIQNKLITAQQVVIALEHYKDYVGNSVGFSRPGSDTRNAFDAREAARQAEIARLGSSRIEPQTAASVSSGVDRARAAASADLDAAIGRFASVAKEVDAGGQDLRDKVAEKVEGATDAIAGYFSANRELHRVEVKAIEEQRRSAKEEAETLRAWVRQLGTAGGVEDYATYSGGG